MKVTMGGNMRPEIRFVCDTLEKLYSEREVASLLENMEEFGKVINGILVLYSKQNYLSENAPGLRAKEKLKFVSGLMDSIKNPGLIFEAGIPHYSTGINVLEDLLKKIVPILETDYKKLTTDKSQRDSFKEHILNATINILKSPRLYKDSEKKIEMGENDPSPDGSVERSKKLEDDNANFSQLNKEAGAIGSLDDSSKKIDISKGGSGDDQEREMFLIPDQDKTGANLAYTSFKKIGRMITDAYQLLDSETDQDDFYEFLTSNLRLYLAKFEEELLMDLPPEKQQQVDAIKEQPEGSVTTQTDQELSGLEFQPNAQN
jgi:hypothetical protein